MNVLEAHIDCNLKPLSIKVLRKPYSLEPFINTDITEFIYTVKLYPTYPYVLPRIHNLLCYS